MNLWGFDYTTVSTVECKANKDVLFSSTSFVWKFFRKSIDFLFKLLYLYGLVKNNLLKCLFCLLQIFSLLEARGPQPRPSGLNQVRGPLPHLEQRLKRFVASIPHTNSRPKPLKFKLQTIRIHSGTFVILYICQFCLYTTYEYHPRITIWSCNSPFLTS